MSEAAEFRAWGASTAALILLSWLGDQRWERAAWAGTKART